MKTQNCVFLIFSLLRYTTCTAFLLNDSGGRHRISSRHPSHFNASQPIMLQNLLIWLFAAKDEISLDVLAEYMMMIAKTEGDEPSFGSNPAEEYVFFPLCSQYKNEQLVFWLAPANMVGFIIVLAADHRCKRKSPNPERARLPGRRLVDPLNMRT